jgi:hypothetical protein
MAEGYLRMFRQYLAGGVLPAGELVTDNSVKGER